MSDLFRLLQETAGVDDYRVSTTARTSYELFFVHRNLETVRATQTKDTAVTVYVSHDGKLGSSDFAVYDSMNDAEIAAKIKAAVERAKLVFNEPYDLPANETFTGELPSNFADFEPKALAKQIADAAFAADDLEGGSINALEVFLYEDVITVENSRGVKKTQTKHHAMVEAIPTWNEGGESVELYENYTFTEFDPATVTEEIRGKMREVRDRYHAQKPEVPMTCDVLLPPHEIASLILRLAGDLNYSAAYSHSNLHKVGDDLQSAGSCDGLTLALKGQLAGSSRSALFDEDGTQMKDRTVISGGKVVAGWGGTRYAQYMKEEPTGMLSCAELAPGTLTEEELAGKPTLTCVSMSGLQLDLYNDYIGGEIRLAYYFDGKETRPVTGISMSGSLKKVLSTLRLSKELASIDGYHGPKQLLLKDMAVL